MHELRHEVTASFLPQYEKTKGSDGNPGRVTPLPDQLTVAGKSDSKELLEIYILCENV